MIVQKKTGPSTRNRPRFRCCCWGNKPPPAGESSGRGGRRRVFDANELRLVLLKLIADQPRHGYDLIRAIEDLTGGSYAPSPGVVYPALSILQDLGQIEEVLSEGPRKAFSAIKAWPFSVVWPNSEPAPRANISLKYSASFCGVTKALNSDNILFTRESFREFPDVWTADLSLSAPKKISDANPQMKSYFWGNVELVNWTSLDNIPLT